MDAANEKIKPDFKMKKLRNQGNTTRKRTEIKLFVLDLKRIQRKHSHVRASGQVAEIRAMENGGSLRQAILMPCKKIWR